MAELWRAIKSNFSRMVLVCGHMVTVGKGIDEMSVSFSVMLNVTGLLYHFVQSLWTDEPHNQNEKPNAIIHQNLCFKLKQNRCFICLFVHFFLDKFDVKMVFSVWNSTVRSSVSFVQWNSAHHEWCYGYKIPQQMPTISVFDERIITHIFLSLV